MLRFTAMLATSMLVILGCFTAPALAETVVLRCVDLHEHEGDKVNFWKVEPNRLWFNGQFLGGAKNVFVFPDSITWEGRMLRSTIDRRTGEMTTIDWAPPAGLRVFKADCHELQGAESVRLDDPSFMAPISARLVEMEEAHSLVWTR